MLRQESEALELVTTPEEASDAERRLAAIVELLDRSGAADRIVNEATLLRMRCAVRIADLIDEGQARGEIAKQQDGRLKEVSGTRTLPIPRQRLAEARAIRDSEAVEWFEQMIDSGRIVWEHALRRAKRMKRTADATARRTPDRRGNAEVMVADIRDFRPEEVDAILTDPPYITADALTLYRELGAFAAEVLPVGGICAAMTSTTLLCDVMRVLSERLTYFWTIAWTFDHGRDFSPLHSHKLYDRWKPTVIFSNGPIRDDREWFHDHIPVRESEKDLHPWQQSLEGMRTLVHRLTVPGQRVCDPFLGSGTTALACIEQGRDFLGSDIDPEAVWIAEKRIEEGSDGGDALRGE
jgi:hypothetical protein